MDRKVNHISVDLETFDSSPTSSIASIGAVEARGYDTFYVGVEDPGGSFSPETIRWHAKQDHPARNTGAKGAKIVPLREALVGFAYWLVDHGASVEGKGLVWSHATFDIPVLTHGYQRIDQDPPWHYRNPRDLRTLYQLAGGRPDLEDHDAHHALADAKYQLEEIRVCLDRLDKWPIT